VEAAFDKMAAGDVLRSVVVLDETVLDDTATLDPAGAS
jgi:hypothetical protein